MQEKWSVYNDYLHNIINPQPFLICWQYFNISHWCKIHDSALTYGVHQCISLKCYAWLNYIGLYEMYCTGCTWLSCTCLFFSCASAKLEYFQLAVSYTTATDTTMQNVSLNEHISVMPESKYYYNNYCIKKPTKKDWCPFLQWTKQCDSESNSFGTCQTWHLATQKN